MIRKGSTEDIDVLIGLTKSCARHMISNGIFQWNDHYPSRTAFEKDVKRQELFVLEVNSSIVGCIVISTFMDEEYENVGWLTESDKNLYIHRLAIDPNYQKKGYAKQLMDYAEKVAKNNGFISIRLDTFSQNQRNINFYELRGYQRLEDIYFPKQSEHPFHCYELTL